MDLKTTAAILPAIAMSILFTACSNEKKTGEPAKADATNSETASMPAYDAAMDPINVEAPFLKLHKDTLGIKLYEVTLNPGDSVGMHTHPDHVFYVVQGGKAKISVKGGEAQETELPAGTALIFPFQTHSGKNTGTTTIKLLVADIYRPRS